MPIRFEEEVSGMFRKKTLMISDAEIRYGDRTIPIGEIDSVSLTIITHNTWQATLTFRTIDCKIKVSFGSKFGVKKTKERFSRAMEALAPTVLASVEKKLKQRFERGEELRFGARVGYVLLSKSGVRMRKRHLLFIPGEMVLVPWARCDAVATATGDIVFNSLDDPTVHAGVSTMLPNALLLPSFVDWIRSVSPRNASVLAAERDDHVRHLIRCRDWIKLGLILLAAGAGLCLINRWSAGGGKYYVLGAFGGGALLVYGVGAVVGGVLALSVPDGKSEGFKALVKIAKVILLVLSLGAGFVGLRYYSSGMNFDHALFLDRQSHLP